MRIVFDARWIEPAPSGIGVYARQLLRRLPALAPDWKWTILFQRRDFGKSVLADCGLEKAPNVSMEVVPYGVHSFRGYFRLPKLLARLRCDLFHSPNYMIPFRAFGPRGGNRGCGVCVTTIHDVIPLLFKDYAPRSRKSRMRSLFRLCLGMAVRRSAAVITVSGASRDDIVRTLRLKPALAGRVRPVYNGVDERYTPPPAPLPPSRATTILYVGRLDPYKNVVTLVQAVAELKRRWGDRPVTLLLVGPEDPRYPEAVDTARALGIFDSVFPIHGATDNDLLDLYREADVFVNPSRYEGFGLPMVEAMRCGTPVVCCEGGAQAEISDGSAEVVPPGDAHALADAIDRVVSDAGLRNRMVEEGLRRAADFSWEKTARKTLEIYREALSVVLEAVPAIAQPPK